MDKSDYLLFTCRRSIGVTHKDILDEVWCKIYRCIHWKQLVLGDDQVRALDELRKGEDLLFTLHIYSE